MSASRVDNIFMVAADVRAVTFDETGGVEKVGTFWGEKKEEHEGKAILRLAKHKLHVCWYEGDMALLVRRATNWGRPALGKNGLLPKNEYMKTLIKDPEGKIFNSTEGGKYCKEWNDQVGGGIGHGYQATPDALAYYLKNMRDHCDKP